MKSYVKQLVVLLFIISFFSCKKDDDARTMDIPTLTSFTPTSGPKTTIVTITGSNFAETSNLQVFFNDVEAVIESSTATQIRATVPPRAYSGLVKVVSDGTELVGETFTYLISDVQVSTFVGSIQGFEDGTGINAEFNSLERITMDAEGTLYVTDQHRVRKITANGTVSTLAGSTQGFADAVGENAQFNWTNGIALDDTGDIYVSEFGNDKIRKVTPGGVVSTFAGSTQGFEDGQGEMAQFNNPSDIVIDSEGNLYIADSINNSIRKITPDGTVSTIAGGTEGYVDGVGINAQFNVPTGLVLDSEGNIYVADKFNNKIRKITSDGTVTTFAGSTEGFADGVGVSAQFENLVDIAIDAKDNLYVTDKHLIRKITPTGTVSTLAGSTQGFADADGDNAQFDFPRGLVVDSQNNIFVTDIQNYKIRKITQE